MFAIGPWNETYTGRRWTLPIRRVIDRCFGRWQDHSTLVLIRATPHGEAKTPSIVVQRSGPAYEATLRYEGGRTATRRYRWSRGHLVEVQDQ